MGVRARVGAVGWHLDRESGRVAVDGEVDQHVAVEAEFGGVGREAQRVVVDQDVVAVVDLLAVCVMGAEFAGIGEEMRVILGGP